MDPWFKINEPGILYQSHIRIVDGDRYILLILESTGQGCRIAYLDRKDERDETD
jgi:hypothetical protein